MTSKIERREFLLRLAGAGLTAAAAGAVGFGLSSDTLPDRRRSLSGQGARIFPDWSIKDAGPKLAVFHGDKRLETFDKAMSAMGGMERFVKPGDVVMLKPNAGFAVPPEFCATTHPEIVEDIVKRCFVAGAAEVRVTDNPVNDSASTFQITGIKDAAERAGAKVIIPDMSSFTKQTLAGGKLIVDWEILTAPFVGCTKVIGACPVKHHGSSGATMTMKNWYGLLGGRRNIFHQRVHEVIAELAMLVTPTLVILDGTWSMVRNGPTGGALEDLEPTGTMIVSIDQVAADTVGASLLGKTPTDLPYLTMAEKHGLGTTNWQSLFPATDRLV